MNNERHFMVEIITLLSENSFLPAQAYLPRQKQQQQNASNTETKFDSV